MSINLKKLISIGVLAVVAGDATAQAGGAPSERAWVTQGRRFPVERSPPHSGRGGRDRYLAILTYNANHPWTLRA